MLIIISGKKWVKNLIGSDLMLFPIQGPQIPCPNMTKNETFMKYVWVCYVKIDRKFDTVHAFGVF